MICALLCYRYQDKFDADVSLEFYSVRRTENQKVLKLWADLGLFAHSQGVTIPSQKRFIRYLDRIIKMKDPQQFITSMPTVSVTLIGMTINVTPKYLLTSIPHRLYNF